MDTFMATLLAFFMHVIVVAAIFMMSVLLVMFIFRFHQPNVEERLLRIAMFSCGLLIYVASQALGITIPGLMYSGLSVTNPLTMGSSNVIVSTAVPTMAGAFVAWFCLRLMDKDTNVAARGLILFSTFVFAMFADSYALIATKATPANLSLALPNISFVVGVILYTGFTRKTGDEARQHHQRDRRQWYEQFKRTWKRSPWSRQKRESSGYENNGHDDSYR